LEAGDLKEDQRAKYIVLVASLLVLGLLGIAALEENVFTEWRVHQRCYAGLLKQSATDQRGKLIAENYQMGLQQVVVPALNVVDRCVSCHRGIDDPRMSAQPNPYKTHPAGLLDEHPVDQFGCSVCHQGQGRATTFRESKGEETHWDYPMLPKSLLQGSCGICHDPAALRAQAPLLALGRELFLEKGCQSCHKLDGVGGTMGPALDGEGAKRRMAFSFARVQGPHTMANWFIEHFKDPQKIVPASRMKNIALTDSESQALTIYLISLQNRDLPRAYLPADRITSEYEKLHSAALPGVVLYQRYCANCHGAGKIAHFDPILQRYIPAIRNRDFLSAATDDFIRATIKEGRPGRDMPSWKREAGGLLEEEISNLVVYLRGEQTASPSYASAYVSRGDASHGKQLFQRHCLGCHGVDGAGKHAPSLSNAAFQAAATDGYIKATIVRGRSGTAMPGFIEGKRPFARLAEQDIEDLVSYLRSLNRQ
jgi:cbb3-type cytochrome c oxidase subunit III